MSEKHEERGVMPPPKLSTKALVEKVKKIDSNAREILKHTNDRKNTFNSVQPQRFQDPFVRNNLTIRQKSSGELHEQSAEYNINVSKSFHFSRRRLNDRSDVLPATLRKTFIANVAAALLTGEVTQGEALRSLRMKVVGLKQAEYATLVGVSRRTVSDFENDSGVTKTDVINKLFKPFGLKVGIVPANNSLWDEL